MTPTKPTKPTRPTRPIKRRAAGAGRPIEMPTGRRVTVFLDAPTLKTAEAVGGGNVSRGIRRALAIFRG